MMKTLVLLFGAAQLAAAQELLRNPGFEGVGPGAPDWSENAWGEPRPTRTVAPGGAPHGGARCQRITVSSLPEKSGFIYRQPFTFLGGHTYRGKVWLRSPDRVRVQVLMRRAGPHYEPCAARTLEVGGEWQEVVLAGGFGEGDVPGFFGFSFQTAGTLEIDDASLADISDEALGLPTPTAPISRAFFGIHINKLGAHNVWPALGQGLLRLWDTGTTWSQLEPKPGEWNWTRLDYYVRHATRNAPGCRLVLTLGIPPAWACDSQAPKAYNGCAAAPLDPETWRRYVRTVGERYKGRIRCWEPWNECDYGGFFNGGPSAMLPLARIAYEELKRIDPENVILSPNVTRAGFGWLDAYLAAGGGAYCDVVSFHRYPDGVPENDVPEYFAVRDLARAHGLGDKPIWNTEGAIERRAGQGDAETGAVARTWLVQWAQGITAFCWYAWDIHWEKGTALGTSLKGAELSPAGKAVAELIRWVDGAVVTRREVRDGAWQLTLRRGEETSWIVWRVGGETPWAVPSASGQVIARDLKGAEKAVAGGAVTVGPCPVLVRSVPAVDVTRFGAKPDDAADDTAAFVAAAGAVQTGGVKRLLIPPGVYHLSAGEHPQGRYPLLCFQNLDGLRVEGAGAELQVSGVTGLFGFDHCTNVAVRGLAVDWPRPPFSVGTVTAAAPRQFDVAVEPEYPVKGGEPIGAFMDYDPATRLPHGRDLDVYGAVERTESAGQQVLRVHLNREIGVPVGKLLVLRHEVYGSNAFVFNRCADVQVSDTVIYTAPGMGLVAMVCENVTLRHFDVLKRPGTRRPMSATADATHFGGCKGTVLVEDCTFEGMGDDGANIKSGLYLSVRKRIDARTVLAQHNLKMTDLPDPGDDIEMSHVDTLLPFAAAKVRGATLEPGGDRLHRVVFEEPLPAGLREGDVLGNATRTPALRMRRCTVRANRARGVLCQTRDAVIEACAFQDCTSAGVLVLTEVVHFFESIGTRQVTVRNNAFENCNAGAASAEAALCAVAYLKNFGYPPRPGVHRDVTFEGNRFSGTDESAIFAAGVDGLTLKGNVVEGACRRGARPNGRCAIRVQDCARVAASGNGLDPGRQGAQFLEPLLVTPFTP